MLFYIQIPVGGMPAGTRVQSKRLADYIGQTVRVVGRVVSVEDQKQAKIEPETGIAITVLK